MDKIVIDEDLHRSVSEPLERLGYEPIDIRDYGLRGSTDQEVYAFAQRNEAAIISGDKDFSNIVRFPLGEHYGIIVARFPSTLSPSVINVEIFNALQGISPDEITGALVVVTSGKVRIRRTPE